MSQDDPRRELNLYLAETRQLFNSMDPSPFRERDLDHDAEEFIVSWAQEYHRKTPLKLLVHLGQPLASGLVERRVKVLLPKVGKRLGSAIPAVMAAARDGDVDGAERVHAVALTPGCRGWPSAAGNSRVRGGVAGSGR